MTVGAFCGFLIMRPVIEFSITCRQGNCSRRSDALDAKMMQKGGNCAQCEQLQYVASKSPPPRRPGAVAAIGRPAAAGPVAVLIVPSDKEQTRSSSAGGGAPVGSTRMPITSAKAKGASTKVNL